MKVSTRIIFSTIIVVSITTLLTISLILQREHVKAFHFLERKAKLLSNVIINSSIEPLKSNDHIKLKNIVNLLSNDRDVLAIAIIDNDPKVEITSAPESKNFIPASLIRKNEPSFIIQRVNRKEYLYCRSIPVTKGNITLGTVLLVLSSKYIIEDLLKSEYYLFAIFFISIIVGIFSIIIMLGLILKPLKKIASTANSLSKGNFNLKINLSIDANDEIGEISKALKYLVTNLKKYMSPLVRTERLAMLGTLASGIAHEVRNPMEPIKGSAELLQNLYKEDPTILKYTQIIKDEINSLSTFLDEFLEFARPQKPRFQPTNVNELVEESLSLMEHYIKEHQMRVSKDLAENLPLIHIDAQQIKQVFINMIINAVQAKREEEGLLKLKSCLEDENGGKKWVTVEFFDYGKGIPPDIIEKIFEPFFTTKEKGSGLGLAICRNIINNHSGNIEIESGYGYWTLIRIKLPVTGKVDRLKLNKGQ